MTEKLLTKTRTILQTSFGWSKWRDATQVFFALSADEEDVARRHEFLMDRLVWEDMGSPTTITLTIEPGDKLNEEE